MGIPAVEVTYVLFNLQKMLSIIVPLSENGWKSAFIYL